MAQLLKKIETVLPSPLDPDFEQLPTSWTSYHVGLRMVEAMQTLRMMPGASGGSMSSWPSYIYEFEDLLAQHEQGELERTHKIQNRTRLSPSLNEITRMETALQWPMHYLLFGAPHLVEAVVWVSHAHSIDRDVDWVVRKRGGFIDTWQSRHHQGCGLIASGLVTDRVRVF